MSRKIIKFLDRLEDDIRIALSHYPIPYSFIGGVSIVLFWRGVWLVADDAGVTGPQSLVISVIILLSTGLFVSFFIGDNIIMTGLKKEKKLIDKTEEEIAQELNLMASLEARLERIEKKLDTHSKQ